MIKLMVKKLSYRLHPIKTHKYASVLLKNILLQRVKQADKK